MSKLFTVEPLYKGHRGNEILAFIEGWPLTQGFFKQKKKNLNGMKVGALPTQAKADTVELCHFVLQ